MKIYFSQSLQAYLSYAKLRRLSPNTLRDYNHTFKLFQSFLQKDMPIANITKHQIQEFLAGYDYLSEKTVLNYHTALSALWTWAVNEELINRNIVRQVNPPRPIKQTINPFTVNDIKLLLDATQYSRPYQRKGEQSTTRHSLPNVKRNLAIIFTLLDTGLRASEFCAIKISDIDFTNHQIEILGKGKKMRLVSFSERTSEVINAYLAMKSHIRSINRPLFTGRNDEVSLTRSGLASTIKRLGNRAGVAHAYPHRFRHTFAINFLRNGGNIFSLQYLLGHSTLEMVKHYLQISEQDCAIAHRKASPITNWKL